MLGGATLSIENVSTALLHIITHIFNLDHDIHLQF